MEIRVFPEKGYSFVRYGEMKTRSDVVHVLMFHLIMSLDTLKSCHHIFIGKWKTFIRGHQAFH